MSTIFSTQQLVRFAGEVRIAADAKLWRNILYSFSAYHDNDQIDSASDPNSLSVGLMRKHHSVASQMIDVVMNVTHQYVFPQWPAGNRKIFRSRFESISCNLRRKST
jgi:hypothetical protein